VQGTLTTDHLVVGYHGGNFEIIIDFGYENQSTGTILVEGPYDLSALWNPYRGSWEIGINWDSPSRIVWRVPLAVQAIGSGVTATAAFLLFRRWKKRKLLNEQNIARKKWVRSVAVAALIGIAISWTVDIHMRARGWLVSCMSDRIEAVPAWSRNDVARPTTMPEIKWHNRYHWNYRWADLWPGLSGGPHEDYQYWYARIPKWCITFVIGLTWWAYEQRMFNGVRSNQCRNCGYVLSAGTGRRCPECGELLLDESVGKDA
jgi:hypothetical protein